MDCPHENIGVEIIYENGVRVSSKAKCDDCGKSL